MSTYPLNGNDAIPVNHCDDEAIVIAFDIEYRSIARKKIDTAVASTYIQWCSPIRSLCLS
jgi:hypothetical protein